MKNKGNWIVNELFGTSIVIYVLGFIHSFVAATETYTSWGEEVTEFHFDLFARYILTTMMLGSFFLGMAAIVGYLFLIKNRLCGSDDGTDEDDEEDAEEKVSEQEIMNELLEKGCISEKEYNDEYNKNLMKINKII